MRRLVLVLALAAATMSPATAAAPANDAFGNAQAITTFPASVAVDLSEATRQPGERIDCGNLRRSVWYSYSATEESDVGVSSGTAGTYVGVYTGATLGALTRVGCTSSYSELRHTLLPGQTIMIQVGSGFEGPLSTTLALKRLYRISGTVTDENDDPISNVCVSRYGTNDAVYHSSTTTDAAGRYTLKQVGSGGHRLLFRACADGLYATEWYDNKTSSNDATIVTVPDAHVDGIDVEMVRGSRIIGTITNERTLGPAAGACVYAYNGNTFVGSGYSNTAGWYFISVAPGTYTLRMSGCAGYFTEWYDNASTQELATPVVVPAQTDVEINTAIDPGGVIKGQILAGGAPVAGECVEVFDASQTRIRTGSTNALGNYSIQGLQEGTYRVRIAGCSWATSVMEWYDGATSFATATPVTVSFETPAIVNADVDPGASISGTVADADGFPALYACVAIYDGSGEMVATKNTGVDGTYKIGALPAGTYKVRFGCDSREFTTTWYGGTDFASATSVTVTNSMPAAGVDGVLQFRQRPSNDAIANAVAIGALPYTDVRDVTRATLESGESSRCGTANLAGSVWYTFRSEEARLVEASTVGTVDVDTTIGVFVQGPTGLILLACENDWAGQTVGERLDIVAPPGIDMFIQVGVANSSYASSLIRFSLS